MDEPRRVRGAEGDSLSREAVGFLLGRSETLTFSDGQTIVRRGDPGTLFFVVLSGRVQVRLTADNDCQLPLADLEEGAFFGEMSILTGTPASADVVALGTVSVLACPAEVFLEGLSECAPLRSQLMKGMASNLQRTSKDAWNFFQRAETLNVLMDTGVHTGPLIAESRAMKATAKAIDGCGGGSDPVLVWGEPGTGKTFLASVLHEAGTQGNSPFIVVDCRTLTAEEAVAFLFGTSRFRRQERSPAGYQTLRRYGALHLAHRGSLVLRHVDALPPAAQEVLSEYLEDCLAGETGYPFTRIVCTALKKPDTPAAGGGLDVRLARLLADRSVQVPPLRRRRKDILPLARLFLEEFRRSESQAFSLQTEHTLISREYSHRNADELREAVEMAVLFADGERIDAEHIFTGPKDRGGGLELDLSQVPLVKTLTRNSVLGGARGVFLAIFAVIVSLSLGLGGTDASRTANAVTWAVWEPLLFVLFLFVGRVWCTVCPLSTAGRIAARVGSLRRAPGDFIKKHTGWLVAAGFIAIIWSEYVFDMTARPFAAGIFLLSLMAAAVVFAVVYRRETWCRYVCPLGNLGAVFATPAVLNVRANPDVCATFCTTHECFKGSGDIPGCPVFHHPLYARDSHHCKQCGRCLTICPHGSARLYLRPPLQGIWRQPDLGSDLTPFALFLFFFSPFMLASQGPTWAASAAGLGGGAALSLASTLVSLPFLGRFFAAAGGGDRALAARVALALLILAWGPAMAYQLNHIESMALITIRAEGDGWVAAVLPGGGIDLRLVLQLAAVLLAGTMAAVSLSGIRMRLSGLGVPLSRGGLTALRLVCTLYTLASVMLVFAGRGAQVSW